MLLDMAEKPNMEVEALKLFEHLGFQDEETRHSLECIQANQIFPRKQLIREDENLQVIPGYIWLWNKYEAS